MAPLVAVITASSTTGSACVRSLLTTHAGRRKSKREKRGEVGEGLRDPLIPLLPPCAPSPLISSPCRRVTGKVRVRGVFRSEEKAAALAAEHGESENYEAVTGVDAADKASLAKAFAGADGALIVTPFDPSRGMRYVTPRSD